MTHIIANHTSNFTFSQLSPSAKLASDLRRKTVLVRDTFFRLKASIRVRKDWNGPRENKEGGDRQTLGPQKENPGGKEDSFFNF